MIALTVIALACSGGLIAAQSAVGKPYKGAAQSWPFRRLQLGLMNGPGQAGEIRAQAPMNIRYQYLSGGVNTGSSWQNWSSGGLSYVEEYIKESQQHHLLPVFSYYQLRQSLPGAGNSDESAADLTNLRDVSTMTAYYKDLIAFYRAAATAKAPVVLHFEPDAFGYIEQNSTRNNAGSVPAAVASTGIPELRGLPNSAEGWARAAIRLRNDYAPNVIVAYADSIWGTEYDIHLNHPSLSRTAWMAARSAAFYRSLHADFNMVFTEVGNEDAGEIQAQQRTKVAWWHSVDYERDAEYISDLHKRLKKPMAIWQIPIGNTIMRAMNNTPFHWQDNHVQWYLGADSHKHLQQLVKAGVVALLFGSGQQTGTAALNTVGNGIRDPKAIDGNDAMSSSADDDGGFFMTHAKHYYHHDLLKLPGDQ